MYEQIIGDEAWRRLPAAIRAIHAPGEVRGTFRVTRGRGLARWIGRLAGFPPACERLPIHLRVADEDGRMVWRRSFGTAIVTTWQEAKAGLVHEHFGPLVCAFAPRPAGEGLDHVQVRFAFCAGPLRFALPAWLSPRIAGTTRIVDGAAHVRVEIEAPLVGLLLRYEGPVVAVESM